MFKNINFYTYLYNIREQIQLEYLFIDKREQKCNDIKKDY